MHTLCNGDLSRSVSLSLTHPLSLYLPLCLSLSDELGDSLFCRKCSHHTDCRLVYSRFNLIIASPAFNQPASACFMLKPRYKHKIDFDTRRLAKLSQKSSTETQDEMELLFFFPFKYSISIFILTLCFKPTRSWRVDLFCALKPLGWETQRATGGAAAASATRKDWRIFTCMHMWRHRLPLYFPQTHAQIHTWRAARWMVQVCENVAMWEFPKAMKYAGCNGRANSLDLTTYVQRKGLLLAKQHTCPVNTVSILTHLFFCYMWLRPTHPSLN